MSGYLVAVVLGLFVGSARGVGPHPMRAVLLAGVVYPLTFGGMGGFLGHRLTTDETVVRR